MEGNIFENFTQRQQVSKAENTSDKQHSTQSWPLIESIRKKRQKILIHGELTEENKALRFF